MKRNLLPLILGVVAVHIAALSLLQANWPRPELVLSVPAQILIELVPPPAANIVTPPPTTVRPAAPKRPRSKVPPALPDTAPPPLALAEPTRSVSATRGSVAPAPNAEPLAAPSVAPAMTATTPGAMAGTAEVAVAPPIELPSNAAYLQNPKPPYPALSRRLGEQGKVVVRVLIEVDGTAREAEINQSSGFDRLDQAALEAVLRWRYVPGRRAGVPQAMWFNIPISFVLE